MLIVKKFGGTSVANKERIFNVARRCIEDYKKGNDVVIVLSAMGKYTDELITMAKDINDKPPKREMDMLFTIGETSSGTSPSRQWPTGSSRQAAVRAITART